MSESHRRLHPAHSGRVTDPILWGFETKELLIISVGFGLSLAGFHLLYTAYHWNLIPALAASISPVGAAVLWILLLVSGKPRRYAADAIDWWLLRLQLQLHLNVAFLAPRAPNTVPHPLLRDSSSSQS